MCYQILYLYNDHNDTLSLSSDSEHDDKSQIDAMHGEN